MWAFKDFANSKVALNVVLSNSGLVVNNNKALAVVGVCSRNVLRRLGGILHRSGDEASLKSRNSINLSFCHQSSFWCSNFSSYLSPFTHSSFWTSKNNLQVLWLSHTFCSLLFRGQHHPSHLRRRIHLVYYNKVLFYLLRDRRTPLFRCSNSSGSISLFLELSFYSQLIFFCIPSCSSNWRGSGVSRSSSRSSFYLLLPLSFWNLF